MIREGYSDLKYYIEMHSNNDKLKILNDTTPAETKIFLFMFFNSNGKCILDWYNLKVGDIYKYMKKYFYVFNIEELHPYMIKSSVVGNIINYEKFVREDVVLNLRYLKNIEDLFPTSYCNKLYFRIKYKFKKVFL